jgi:GTP pyrophosphokinase
MTFDSLIQKLSTYLHICDIECIKKAYSISEKAHEGQFRESNIPYIQHPLEVAHILADLRLDASTLAAGLLHDCLEDTAITPAYIIQEFGEEIAHLVEGVTKIDKLSFSSHEEAQDAP